MSRRDNGVLRRAADDVTSDAARLCTMRAGAQLKARDCWAPHRATHPSARPSNPWSSSKCRSAAPSSYIDVSAMEYPCAAPS